MVEKKFGDVTLKANYAAGEMSLLAVYDKELIDLEFSVKAEAKELVRVLLGELVESTETELDDKALAFILDKL